MVIVRGVNLFPTAVRFVVLGVAPPLSGAILLRPTQPGVRQEPPVPIDVELAEGQAGDPSLADAIEKAVRSTLIAIVRVRLLPFGELPRSDYKTKPIAR